MQYFFILGRNPELSLAELHAILPKGYQTIACSREVLVVECPELAVEKLMKRLGGTVKVGEIISRNTHHVARNTMLELLRKVPRNKKLYLGLSAYALDDKVRLPSVRELREMGIELKRELQAQGYRMRLVTSRERALSSVIVKKEKLLSQGAEIVLMYGGPSSGAPEDGPQYIATTLAAQEFEEASVRDFGRPVREMKVGMLPIQLAKTMINLARAPLDATLLDPFCGFGTILAEARLMGYTNLIGSDLERMMVDATRKNLNWLFSDSRELENVKLLVTPVEQLSKHISPRSVDAVVTEPYLGPTQKISNFQFLISNLVDLYIAAFREFAKIFKPGGRVVFIFPAFVTKRRAPSLSDEITKTSVRVLPKIKNLGFTPMPLLPIIKTMNCELSSVNSLTYSRPNQRVLREIFVLELKPRL